MTFADDFERLVAPALATAVKVQGMFIAIGVRTWSEGYVAVWRLAMTRGATHLPEDQLARLEDWIAAALLVSITAAEPLWQEAEETARRVGDDIDRHERRYYAT